ncbi:MAG: DUF4340 domain-containing protein [Oscillospiraceae bacterium]|nr:DUF4340 domain-containing protein [Oscillospiraceae bacterium]MBR4100670.1 DUF4340 domain-containing protein [Oscillospiraceae bacterium]
MSKEEKQSMQEQDDELQAGMDTFFAEPSPKQEQQKKTGGMSKTTKGLIAGVSVLVLLGGGLTAAMLLRDQDGESSGNNSSSGNTQPTEEQELIPLNENLAEDLTQVEIKGKDTFTMFRVSEKTEEESAVYSIKGMEDLPLSNNLLSTLANNACELYAYDLVEENAENLDKYGLAKPDAQITMHYEDGTKFSMSIGMESPLDNVYTYAQVGDDVYLVKSSPMENYRKETTFFLSTTILEEPEQSDYPIVESVRIEREDLEYDIYLEYVEEDEDASQGGAVASHVMREPVFAYLTPDKSTDVTNGMFGLYAAQVVAAHPTDDELEDAGILEPFCTVTMKCDNGKTYSLYLGDTYQTESGDQKCYYAYLDGVDVLYGVSADNAVWATMKPGDITSENILNTYVWDIATLDVSANGKKIRFEGEGDKDSYEVKKDGVACDKERFRLFYRFLLYVYGEELYLDGEIPDAAPDTSIHVVTQDGSEDILVEFYKLDNLNALVVINGQPTYKTRASSMEAIEKNIEIFDTNEEFITIWR